MNATKHKGIQPPGCEEGEFEGASFNDSDVYKIVKGMAWSLAGPMKGEHREFPDDFIALLAEAQMDDGCLFTPDAKPSKFSAGILEWAVN